MIKHKQCSKVRHGHFQMRVLKALLRNFHFVPIVAVCVDKSGTVSCPKDLV